MRTALLRLVAASHLAALALMAPVFAQAPEPGPLSKAGYTFPESLLDFRRISYRDYEPDSPGLGFSVGYRNPILIVTVYLYDRKADDIGNGTDTPAVAGEFEQSFAELKAAVEQGVYRDGGRFQVTDRGEILATPDMPVAFRYLAFELIGEQSRRRSYLFLTGLRGKFLKLRITAAPNAANVDDQTRSFLKVLGEELTRP